MQLKNKKFPIFLTGSSGLFGINFYMNSKNKQIYYLIHKRKINLKNKVSVNLEKKEEIVNFLKQNKIKTVIHAASFTSIDFIEKNKKISFKNIYKITKNISVACKEANTKLVYISTDQLYSGLKKKYFEYDKTSPINYYGYLKKISEEIVLINSKDNLILRTNFFGFGTQYRKSFSDFIIGSLKYKKKIHLADDTFFSPVYVKTLIKIIFKLIKINANGIFNISSDEKISKYNFGKKISSIFKLNQNLINRVKLDDLNLVKRPKNMYLVNNKLKKRLKIKKISLDREIFKLRYDYMKRIHIRNKKII
jgi:dTDP-4-dehydrorhamnose reductase